LGFLEDGEADFVAVYHAWYPAMVRLAVLIVSDRQEAEEVAQDAFVAAYRRWGRIATPVPYIRRSVVNRGRDVLRRRRLASALRLRPAHDTEPAPTEPVDDLLATLPPRQRAAVVLRFYEDLTVDEIATTLHARPGTVKSLLHRALARLREEIER
jgi:RNA polymerase sigma-70 factor (sigma-E family)